MMSSDYSGYPEWKQWNEKSFGVYTPEHAVYFSAELQRSGVTSVAGTTILEIGFGNGEFAAWARDAGAAYLGTESLDELVELAIRAGFNAHSATQPLEALLGGTPVDLIVAFDVFEHLDADALRQVLHSAHLALRPLGRLIFRVPSGDSPFSRAIQHGDATHRVSIGSSMVRQLARDAGFVVESVREPCFPLFGLGLRVFIRRAIVAGARASAFVIMTRIFMGGGRHVLTPNMVCVLVRP